MHCINPIKAGYTVTGDLTYNTKLVSKELEGIQFECRKCLPCRLNIAREKALRCIHEASTHEENIFLTLTYSDEHLLSPKLQYKDWQDFAKRLRKTTSNKITYMVTGEYGDKNKRPHWHAIIFNYRPPDAKYYLSTDRGDKIHTSSLIDELWSKNDPTTTPSQIGEVTIDSAGYVARYAAKKLTHGLDGTHDYNPLHKTSSKRAIGRTWIEQNYKHAFENGYCVLQNGQITKIPRYYVDWAKIHQPKYWEYYVTQVRPTIHQKTLAQARKEELEYLSNAMNYTGDAKYPLTRAKVKETILKSKFKRLQERLKL